MQAQKKKVQGEPEAQALPSPMISEEQGLIAGFYQMVQSGPRRLGFAVLDTKDKLNASSLAPVQEEDAKAVAALRATAEAYLSKGHWREMQRPDWTSFEAGRDSLQWKPLNLTATVTHEGNLWFSQTDSGRVLGVTPFASTLIEKRGCSLNMMYHNIVFNDLAGFDPKTRLAFLGFDIIEGDQDSPYFVPFKCDISALVHVVKVSPGSEPAP